MRSDPRTTTVWFRAELRRLAIPENVPALLRFFRTGVGEYGEGDRFIGVRVPALRKLVKEMDALALEAVLELLTSPIHEERLLALMTLVRRSERGPAKARADLAKVYLRHTVFVNNWDLVDSSAPQLLGAWVLDQPAQRKVLERLVRSKNLWERRMAIVATQKLIRAGELEPTWALAERLRGDRHDLMHKATGWMLREAGARDPDALTAFLERHGSAMPRTMLRYAIEHRPPEERREWLRKTRG